jgi:serine/threonine protein kinase
VRLAAQPSADLIYKARKLPYCPDPPVIHIPNGTKLVDSNAAGTHNPVGPYEIFALLGAGGMGEVYKARDTRLDRVVAIKISNEQFSEHFEREAHVVAPLNHSHVCTLHNIGPNYLVMEYVEGTALQWPFPVAQALNYAAQICDALDAAHKKGFIHRDLKPANILVTRSGIKLLDFGLAKISLTKIALAKSSAT